MGYARDISGSSRSLGRTNRRISIPIRCGPPIFILQREVSIIETSGFLFVSGLTEKEGVHGVR